MKEKWELQEEIREKLKDFYYNKLSFCGCGNPEDTLKVIKDILNELVRKEESYYDAHDNKQIDEWYESYENNIINICGFKSNESNNESKFSNNQYGLYLFVLYYLNQINVLEHGGSVGGSWLTDYGKEILNCLNEYEDLETVLN